jgi:flagellin
MKNSSVTNGATTADVAKVTASAAAALGQTSIAVASGAAADGSASTWTLGSDFDNAAGTTKLTALASGSNLGLQVGDEITFNAVVGGEVKNTVFVVTADSTLNDLAVALADTVGGTSTVHVATGAVANNGFTAGLDAWATSGAVRTGDVAITGKAGAANNISSFSITAKSTDGIERSSFNAAVNTGANGGLKQLTVATNSGDYVARVDVGNGGVNKGDSVVAIRDNAIVKTSNLTIEFGDSATTGGTATITTYAQNNSASIHIGANEGQTTNVSVNAMDATALGLKVDGVNISVLTSSSAEKAITSIENALKTVSSERSKLGAIQNRLEHTINNLGTSSENLTASESRIRDVDMAKEMMEFTKNNILMQAAQAMLAQANQQPQGVLQLLR